MEITKISTQARNPERVNLYVDGKFYRGLDRLVAIKLGLRPGLTLNPILVGKLETTQSENSAWEWALRSLQISSKTVREMRVRLSRKFEPAIVDTLMQKLLAADLLNDQRFAEQLARRYGQQGTKSKREILLKLIQKGIDFETAKGALVAEVSDTNSALTLAQIKNRSLPIDLSWQERYTKIASYLARKGFGYTEIRQAVTKINLDLETK